MTRVPMTRPASRVNHILVDRPYLEVTFRTMPLGFNLATLTEIFFQNFLTGVIAAYLFGKPRPADQK